MATVLNTLAYIRQAERVAANPRPERGRRMTTMGEVAIAKALVNIAQAITALTLVIKEKS